MDQQYDFGMVGLGVMGRNFLLNLADSGYSAAGLDLDKEKAQALDDESGELQVRGTTDKTEFVRWLKTPRRIMLLVPAGKAVDAVIEDLLPHLEPGDLIIDGGNSHYEDTERRLAKLKKDDIEFLGVGVSGGAEGARKGPSIMPGGEKSAYQLVKPILEAVAAKVKGDPCVAYLGKRSAGHFVKMVHNGIEYALMQLIAEAYDLLHEVAGASNEEIHRTFSSWNDGVLRSFLMEISADIFSRRDDETGRHLIDLIMDKAKQKGTGKWTSQSAMDLGIPIPTIDAAVSMRGISSFKQQRIKASGVMPVQRASSGGLDKEQFKRILEEALYFSFVVSYAQGMHLLAEASTEFDYELNLEEIAKIWRGGCIIRADLLETIRKAYQEEAGLSNLLFSSHFQSDLIKAVHSTRMVVQTGIGYGLPVLAFSSALNYFQAFHTRRLPLNLVQAQRDYFGSHTYERIDKEGAFHTEW